jgi:hypothetical protein
MSFPHFHKRKKVAKKEKELLPLLPQTCQLLSGRHKQGRKGAGEKGGSRFAGRSVR